MRLQLDEKQWLASIGSLFAVSANATAATKNREREPSRNQAKSRRFRYNGNLSSHARVTRHSAGIPKIAYLTRSPSNEVGCGRRAGGEIRNRGQRGIVNIG